MKRRRKSRKPVPLKKQTAELNRFLYQDISRILEDEPESSVIRCCQLVKRSFTIEQKRRRR